MKRTEPAKGNQLSLGRSVSVIFGPYAGTKGTIIKRDGDLLRVRVSPPSEFASEISVRVDDIKFID